MGAIVFILFILSFGTAYTMLILHHMHMFQLNSYKPNVHNRWLLEHKRNLLGVDIWFLLTIPLLLFFPNFGEGMAIVIYGFLAYFSRPKKAKKPLVYTKRVQRMLMTNAILFLIVVFVCAFLQNSIVTAFVFPVLGILAPWMILAANCINQPLEKSINQRFINEAKDMIHSMPQLTVIGVTGSYGKTSVKFYLQKLLSAKYNVLITPENYNTTLGVVRTIRENLRATHEIFVCEMGAKNIGDIKEICDLVHPTHGVITSIGPQHLESFLTIENVLKTKYELADTLPENGLVFLNYDNEYIVNYPVSKTIIPYGTDHEASKYRPYDITVSSKGSTFKIKDADDTEKTFTTKLIGKHNVTNIAAAIAIAHELGVSLDDCATQVRRLEGVPHRLQLIQGNHALIIDDAYNSNPSGAKAALDTLQQFDGCKIIVTPGMVELGTKQYEYNKIFGTQIAQVVDYAILVGVKQTEPIQAGLKETNYPPEKISVTENLTEALAKVEQIQAQGMQKIVLLENDLPDNY